MTTTEQKIRRETTPTAHRRGELPEGARFQATCRLGVLKPFDALTPEEHTLAQEQGASAFWSRKLGAHVVPLMCNYGTRDAHLFDAHMANVHGRKLGTYQGMDDRRPFYAKDRLPVRMWKAPKLTEEGVPFEDAELKPGFQANWKQGGVQRTGQVWCAAGPAKSWWVVPDEPQDSPSGRLELAVMLTVDRNGEFYPRVSETCWSTKQRGAA